jgi:hypothetical protein
MLIAVLSAAVCVVGAGCGDGDIPNGQTPTAAPSTSSPGNAPRAGPDEPPGQGTSGTPSTVEDQEDRMKIDITIGWQRFRATLADSAAARDLIADAVSDPQADGARSEATTSPAGSCPATTPWYISAGSPGLLAVDGPDLGAADGARHASPAAPAPVPARGRAAGVRG